MEKDDIIKRVNQIITLLTPLIAFSFKDLPSIVLVLPIISVVSEILLDFYFKKPEFKVRIKDLPFITIHKMQYNYADAYGQICWYINKKCKIEKLVLQGFYKETPYGSTARSDVPVYGLEGNIETEFKFESHTIYVNTSEKCDELILYSKNVNILQDLVLQCAKEYKQYLDNTHETEYYKLFTPSNRDYGDKMWISSAINTIKNKRNVFLSDKNYDIFDSVNRFYKSKELYHGRGIPYKKGILLHGLPGTGKSSVVYAIANELKMNIYKLSLLNLSNDQLINYVRSIPSKSIILIEDIDTVKTTHDRNKVKDDVEKPENNKMDENVNKLNLETLLNILDGYSFLYENIIFFTTNHVEKLDPALIRPGRMDEQYEFTYACKKQIRNMLDFYDIGHKYNELCNKQTTTAELTQICLKELNI